MWLAKISRLTFLVYSSKHYHCSKTKSIYCPKKHRSASFLRGNWVLQDMRSVYLFALLLSGPVLAIKCHQSLQTSFDSTKRLANREEVSRKSKHDPVFGREVYAAVRYGSHQDGQEETLAHATSIERRANDKQTDQPNHPSKTDQRGPLPSLPPEVAGCIDSINQKHIKALWVSRVNAVEALDNFEATRYCLEDHRVKNYISIRFTSLNCPYQLSKEYKQTLQQAQKAVKTYVKAAENHAIFMKAQTGPIHGAKTERSESSKSS